MNKWILAVIAVVIIAGGGALALLSNKSDTTTKNTTSNTSNEPAKKADTSTRANTQASASTAATNTITYSDSGFSPASLTVKAGDKVTVKNTASSALQFDSNPHPQHTDDPELNIGLINPGQSQTITVTKTGSHGYHNHLNSGDTGMLIVQ